MNLSIRNQIPGTVVSVAPGGVMATVKARLTGGQEITAAVTREAVDELGIAVGGSITALIKSTEVSLATGPVEGLSIRNQIPGKVTAIATGEIMATVKLAIDGGCELTAAITRDAVSDLGLAEGAGAIALIKSTEVALATG